MHCCLYCVQTDIGKIQTQFRPKKYWNSDQIQTDFDHFQQKFRPTETRQPDAITTTLIFKDVAKIMQTNIIREILQTYES